MSGVVKSGANGTAVFTLPAGYRPSTGGADVSFPVTCAGGLALVNVKSATGLVTIGNITGTSSTYTMVPTRTSSFSRSAITTWGLMGAGLTFDLRSCL